MIPLQLPLAGFRRGLLCRLPVGPEYMAGVEARARMLARACRLVDEVHAMHPTCSSQEPPPPVFASEARQSPPVIAPAQPVRASEARQSQPQP